MNKSDFSRPDPGVLHGFPPFFAGDSYVSPPPAPGWLARCNPSLVFYLQAIGTVCRASWQARHGRYDSRCWSESSLEIVRALESVGCRLEVRGVEHLRGLDGPCLLIGNHMSTLETFVLPSLVMPWLADLTFVVKRSLTEYPVFGHVMRSRDPVVVDRVNPRDDLKAVLEEGAKRLADGRSLVIFPQHTRTVDFDPAQFNSIGIKLAARTGVPVVPLALLTWAWSPGKLHKDYGPILPERTIHFEFGAPLTVSGRGNDEHQQIIDFIGGHLARWRGGD
ncbi:MAG: lysophospholipid acyltransferase family protein [Desulfuromonadales bacterium]|nr:lysophospholipid acyltransferase family protein [Desulfuromonadales bacterium]